MQQSFKQFVSADLPAEQRVKLGLSAEDFVVSVLRNFLGDVRLSSEREDRGKAKLDAYITFNRQTVKAQIKCREGGDDIIVEWYKDWEHRIEGRDKISQAELYVTMDPARTKLYLISAAAIKQACESMFETWTKTKQTRFPTGELKLQNSRDTMGAQKVMIYLHPAAFNKKGLPGWPTIINIPASLKTVNTHLDPRGQ